MMNSEQLDQLNLRNLSPLKFYARIFSIWLRINIRFIRHFWANKNYGFAGFCLAASSIFLTISQAVTPTEEKMKREGIIDRDNRGYY